MRAWLNQQKMLCISYALFHSLIQYRAYGNGDFTVIEYEAHETDMPKRQPEGQERRTVKISFQEIIEDTPIIAAVKDMEGLEKCLSSDLRVIFILFGDICNIGSIVNRIKEAGKIAMVHMELVSGMSGREIAVDFIKQNTKADGIITTKSGLIKYAKQLGFYTVHRYFVMDSMALSNIEKQAGVCQPDVIEILPGIMPGIIKKVSSFSRVPIIAGGLIQSRQDVMTALGSGAVAVSATSHEVWFL